MSAESRDRVWGAVDRYLCDRLIPADAVLEAALQANAAAGLPEFDVAPNQGKFLHLMAQLGGARRILEIGTLGGYSTIWLARALPTDGVLITLEFNAKHAEVARENIGRAGLSSRVEVRVGLAAESLARLHDEAPAPFDLIFIDADKQNNPVYLAWALRLARLGTVIVVDNVVREGALIDAGDPDPKIVGTRRMFDMIAADRRLDATALQTVGAKGHDGFLIAMVQLL